MRIAALSSSVAGAAPLVSPAPSDTWENLKRRAAQTDWTPWLIVGLGAFLRFFLLGIKPPHFDEGINGWFVDQMVKNGFYRYDPTNYHGPLHFYILFVCQTLLGRNIWALRLPVVLASIFSIHLTMKFEPFVGRNVSRLAALAMAVSPAFIFYGRYSIHEVWLLLFSMLFMLGLLGLWKRGTVDYLWCAGMGLAGMILTKETYIIHVACAVIAMFVTWFTHRLTPMPDSKPVRQTWTAFDFMMMSATGIAVIVFFYSGAFMNWQGVTGLWKAFAAWTKTGTQGAGHEKESYYWLELVVRYELPIALALGFFAFASTYEFVRYRKAYLSIAMLFILFRVVSLYLRYEGSIPWGTISVLFLGFLLVVGAQFLKHVGLRYLTIYGVGTLMAYSIVKYKTPWCIISVVWPFLFAFAALPTLVRFRRTAMTVAAAAIAISLGFSISLNYFRCSTFNEFSWTSERGVLGNVADFYDWEPYVYVQTYNDVWKLTKPLLRLAKSNPTYYQLVGHLIRTSTYPLPWMLGDFTKVGYYEHDNMPDKLDGDFLLVQKDKIEEVEAKLHDTYYTEPMTIRPYQDPSKLYFNAKVFHKLFPGRVPEFVGNPAQPAH